MSSSIIIKEKYSEHWPLAAILSGIFSILLFIAYIYSDNVLYEGYLRLGAFGMFAFSFFSMFKIYDGQIIITIEPNDEKKELVDLSYSLRNREIYRESINPNEIVSFRISEMPNRSMYNDLFTGDRTVQFRKKNMYDWMYLNEFHGRIIPFNNENA
ncbi:MAG: hypothetical protein WD381_05025, partial [Balneolaceae bacterium]